MCKSCCAMVEHRASERNASPAMSSIPGRSTFFHFFFQSWIYIILNFPALVIPRWKVKKAGISKLFFLFFTLYLYIPWLGHIWNNNSPYVLCRHTYLQILASHHKKVCHTHSFITNDKIKSCLLVELSSQIKLFPNFLARWIPNGQILHYEYLFRDIIEHRVIRRNQFICILQT